MDALESPLVRPVRAGLAVVTAGHTGCACAADGRQRGPCRDVTRFGRTAGVLVGSELHGSEPIRTARCVLAQLRSP